MNEKERSAKKNKDEINKKTNIPDLIFFDLYLAVTLGLAFFLISVATSTPLKIYLPIILLVIIISNFPMKKYLEKETDIAYLFVTEEYVEVVPLPLSKYKYLRLIETDTTKFYATLKNGLEVTVYIQISAGEKLKFFENISYVDLDLYYAIIKPE